MACLRGYHFFVKLLCTRGMSVRHGLCDYLLLLCRKSKRKQRVRVAAQPLKKVDAGLAQLIDAQVQPDKAAMQSSTGQTLRTFNHLYPCMGCTGKLPAS